MEITVKELEALAPENVLLLDMRSEESRRYGTIPGAKGIEAFNTTEELIRSRRKNEGKRSSSSARGDSIRSMRRLRFVKRDMMPPAYRAGITRGWANR